MTIDSPKQHNIPALRKLWQEAFEDGDDFLDGFFSTGFSPIRCRCLWQNNTLAAALYWFDCQWAGKKVAYVYAVATLKDFQGKGLCRALMEDTHAHLHKEGYAGAVLVPGSEELFKLYGKLGYAPCCKKTELTMQANKPVTNCRQITVSEYHNLQKMFLPENAVFHGETALVFVATFCKFYAGEGFAFCAGKDEDTLYFQEFLGDISKVPGILTALKAEKGVLRIPGGREFAMYHSLHGDSALPDYFDISMG